MSCPDENTLTELAAGLVDPARLSELEAHVDQCPSCHELLVAVALASPPTGEEIEPDPLPPGPLAGRYELSRVLGAGGMSLVYEARDVQLDRSVAVKVMLDAPGDIVAQLHSEGRALAMLRHPNVAQIYDVGLGDAHAYIVTELVEGGTLLQWWARAERTWREGVELMRQAARGLAAAHDAGLVHRDVSPNNILVAHDGQARLVDFGLALELDGPTPSTIPPSRPGDAETVAPAGTPGYVAPEVLQGASVTPAADQYGLCATFAQTLEQRAGLPRRLRLILERGMQADPALRFSSVAELEAALATLVTDERRVGRWVLALGAAGLASAAGLVLFDEDTSAPTPRSSCESSMAAMEATWSPTAREQIAASALADEQSATRVHARLDRYVAEWRALHQETCDGLELSAREIDLRHSCLDTRHQTFDALIDRLARSSALDLTVALGAADALPPIADCRDPDARRRAPSVHDPDELAQHRAVQRTIDEVKAAAALGATDEARAQIGTAITRAQALDASWLLAAALTERGRLERESGDMDAAVQTLEEAAHLAASEGDHRLAARAWIMHLAIRGLFATDLEQVEQLRRTIDASLSRLSQLPPYLEAFQQYTLGTIYDQVGASQLAYDALQRSIELYATSPNSDDEVCDVMEALAVNRARAGDRARARDAFERVLELRRSAFGAAHPEVGRALANIAALDSLDGRFDSAQEHARAANSILEPALGSEHPAVLTLHATLGQALLFDGRPESALEHLRISTTGRARALGASHPATMSVRLDLASCLEQLERPTEAATEFTRVRRELDDPSVPPMLRIIVLTRAGRMALRDGASDEALRECEAAIRSSPQDDLEPALGSARICVGLSLAALGRPDEALIAFEEALSQRYLELSILQTREELAEELRGALGDSHAEPVERLARRLRG